MQGGFMTGWLDWGVEFILQVQQWSPALDLPFKFLTFMGNEEFFLLFLPFIYWCVDRRAGVRLTLLFLFSAYVNSLCKVLVAQPRPFVYDTRVRAIVHAGGYGFPSGHTQGAVVVWGFLARTFRRPTVIVLCVFLMLGIPFSRVYLGVHFPTDLLGGYLIGAFILSLFSYLEPYLQKWIPSLSLKQILALALGIPLVLVACFPKLGPSGVTAGATMAGMGVGFALENRLQGFQTHDRWRRRLISYVLGIFVLLVLWLGLKIAFKHLEPAPVFRFIRYFVVGLWGSWLAPMVFVKLGLAQRRSPAA
jgi:membrane-associated phospholipid phosphatase